MCYVETNDKIANSVTVSRRIARNWSWVLNYDKILCPPSGANCSRKILIQ